MSPDFLGEWLLGMVILGVGAGLTFPTLSGAAVGSVPGPRFAVATSLNSVARQVGAALGVAILIAIIGKPSPPMRCTRSSTAGCSRAAASWRLAGVSALVVAARQRRPAGGSDIGAAARRRRGAPDGGGSPLPSLAESLGEHAVVAPQTVAEFLRNVPVFAALSAEMLEQIAELASSVSLRRGEWLFREGDPADGVYVRARRAPRGDPGRTAAGGDQHAHPRRRARRARAAQRLRAQRVDPRAARQRAAEDRQGEFDSLLRSEPELALGLTRVLSAQLQASRAIPPARRARPVTIVLRALGPGVPLLELADELSRAMCAWGKVAVLYPASRPRRPGADASRERRRSRGSARSSSAASWTTTT